ADVSDDLALVHAGAGLQPAGISGHVTVGGLIAVGVTQAHVFAVSGFPADLFDRAVAGGVDRRSVGGCPIDAGVHFHVAEDRVAADAEARTHHAKRHRLAEHEFLRTLAPPPLIL